MNNEFSGWGLGIEPVRGLRRWNTTPGGYLKGHFSSTPWKSGENRSVCLFPGRLGKHLGGKFETCLCGFYAYHDFSSPNYGGQIEGVIEGYGQVIIGDKGFRCTKAKIVAICPSGRRNRFLDWFLPIYLTSYGIYFLILGFTEENFWFYPVAGFLFFLVGGVDVVRNLFSDKRMYKIKKHYPDVKTFRSRKKMLEKFPLTPVEEIYPMIQEASPGYFCPRCHMTTYNPVDIHYQYCGHCHKFAPDNPLSAG